MCVDIYFLSGTCSSPPVGGTRPPPCVSFSLTMIDDHQAVLFGGTQSTGKSNDVYVLSMTRMVSYMTDSLQKHCGE